MRTGPRTPARPPRSTAARSACSLAVLACAAAALACVPGALGDTATSSPPAADVSDDTPTTPQQAPAQPLAKGAASATLEQCATAAAPQTERSATFAGEMAATTDTARMSMRIDLEELAAGEAHYHTVTAPGLGVWQHSDPGVKTFTHIQQVTNLSAPALYRGTIHFHWLNAKGRVIKVEELHTASCEQPTAASTAGGSATTPIAAAG